MINHTIFYGLYNPFMVIMGMVYYRFNHIIRISQGYQPAKYGNRFTSMFLILAARAARME